MKKNIVLIAVLGASVFIAHAADPATTDTFSAASTSNAVAIAKQQALAAMTSSDEVDYRIAVSSIETFSDEVSLEDSFPASERPSVKDALDKLSVVTEAMTDSFANAINGDKDRLDQLSKLKPTDDKPYGIDSNEARSMVITDITQRLSREDKLLEKMAALDASLKKQSARLAGN